MKKRRKPIRKDDQAAVLRGVGPVMPAILREAMDDGLYYYDKSRAKDLGAYPDYTECTRANMLYDRMAASLRHLVDVAQSEGVKVLWRITPNNRSTEVLFDDRFAFRIKRTKANRGGRSTNVATHRQRGIKSPIILPVGQLVLQFPDEPASVLDMQRIWLTAAFDLDETEESLVKVSLGIETRRKFLWKVPLPKPDADVVATISPALADRIVELRRRRSA